MRTNSSSRRPVLCASLSAAAMLLACLVPNPARAAPPAKGIELVNRVIYEELCLGVVKNESRAEYLKVIDELVKRGAQAVVELGDLTEPGTADKLAGAAREAFGGLDVLIANAGLPVFKSMADGTREELDYNRANF